MMSFTYVDNTGSIAWSDAKYALLAIAIAYGYWFVLPLALSYIGGIISRLINNLPIDK